MKTNRIEGHLRLQTINFVPHQRTTFAFEKMIHEVFGDIFHQSRKRIRLDDALPKPSKTFVSEGTKLGLRHDPCVAGFGGEEPVHSST